MEHGLSFLEKYLFNSSGQVYKSILIEKNQVDLSHDLYDYAFVIFAMSKIYTKKQFKKRALEIASKSLDWIKTFWKHKEIGFLEDPQNRIICELSICISWSIIMGRKLS